MSILLDTHTLIWWIANDPTISAETRRAIADGGSTVFVSAVSAWEIAIKKSTGKLTAPDDVEYQIERHGFAPLGITITHGIAAGSLPLHHRDPFDRMLVAQAMAEGLTIVTRDPRIARYGVPTLRA